MRTSFSGSLIALIAVALVGCSSDPPPPSAQAAPAPSAPVVASNTWNPLTPSANPPGRIWASMAYDAAHGKVVLFGGNSNISGNPWLGDTWTWDGTTWTQQTPATSPTARHSAAMVYDAANSQVVLFGGGDTNGELLDTWTWDGTTWTQRTPANPPTPRQGAGMVYDTAISKVVLFGGINGGNNPSITPTGLDDTWTWDGTTWTALTTPTNGPAGAGRSMVYDTAHNKTVLYTGGNTWTFDGTTWSQHSAASPPTRGGGAMAYNVATSTAVLFGGNTSNNAAGWVAETWTWDGTTWTQQTPATAPSARAFGSMAYDSVAGKVVHFGGSIDFVPFADTWTWS